MGDSIFKDMGSRYDKAMTLPDLFGLVKTTVEMSLGHHRAGIMLAMADLGLGPGGFIGAYFTVGSNAIVVNRQALDMVRSSRPDLYKPYMFHILLHEFLHSVGYLDEATTRDLTLRLSREAFGKDHPVTKVAMEFDRLFGSVILPVRGYRPPRDVRIDLVQGFDRSNTDYIR